MFVSDSLSATRNAITAHCLKHIAIPCHFDNPLCLGEKMYCHMALHWQAGHSELTTEKIADIFCLF
jgi:hypothetical protein